VAFIDLGCSPPSPPRVLVCGGRDFADAPRLWRILDALHTNQPFACIIHGAARGADSIAGQWAKARQVPCQAFPADWKKHGRAAGIIRNQQMLAEGQPTFVIAFDGGRGTADMLRRAKAADLEWMHSTASAIEARRAIDGAAGVVHESADGDSRNAQKPRQP
jgi:hypothetical protein